MSLGSLQVLETALLSVIALVAHVYLRRARKPLLAGRDGASNGRGKAVAAASDVVVFLFYTAFIAAAVPFESSVPGNVRRFGRLYGWGEVNDVERMLNTVALFAVFVAVVEVLNLLVTYAFSERFRNRSEALTQTH